MKRSNYSNKDRGKYIYRNICMIILTVVEVFVFALFMEMESSFLQLKIYGYYEKWLLYVLYGFIVVISIKVFDGYMIGVNRISTSIISQILGLLLADVLEALIVIIMAGIGAFIDGLFFILLKVLIVQVVVAFLFTYITSVIYREKFPPHRMLMIYGDHNNNLGEKICKRDDRYTIVDRIYYGEGLDEIGKRLGDIDAILINDIPSEKRNLILKMCFYNDIRVYFVPKLGDIFVKYSDELKVFDTPIYFCRNSGLDGMQRAFKRFCDILISILGIIILSPVMLIISIMIKTNDGGKVFYTQNRCTIGGKEFRIIKFRTMREDAEKDGRAKLATIHDERITSVGKVLRKTRLDEIPQLFNVLIGEMSLVGPRPERPEIISKYVEDIPEFEYRMKVKAGITGYAQVYGKYNTSDLDKLKLDMMYIQKNSILLDIQLLLLTIRVIFFKDASQGIDDD